MPRKLPRPTLDEWIRVFHTHPDFDLDRAIRAVYRRAGYRLALTSGQIETGRRDFCRVLGEFSCGRIGLPLLPEGKWISVCRLTERLTAIETHERVLLFADAEWPSIQRFVETEMVAINLDEADGGGLWRERVEENDEEWDPEKPFLLGAANLFRDAMRPIQDAWETFAEPNDVEEALRRHLG
jgi:hypothetical protein